ncbi:hypothetical protein EAH89_19785 [Roseomonas nepalensis]|uniref:Uncharacterized protein n=1 Tax=Muricoccus nepalensis TaxID=1854500 RepID=A0A502FR18_9PROT|nr:hypothetical protein [Roseomonas nepalensis]TPG51839.1 hypothetical protein EAH89_19785 [Roseomonas nepalensis]
MRFHDLLPALAMIVLATVSVLGSRLWPEGEGPVLVRLGAGGMEALFGDPALAGVSLVDTPAPGFAVLAGDGAAIRSAFGLTLAWRHNPPCSPRP